MENKILRFLFGWVYDFDVEDNKDCEMTDEEAEQLNENFDKLNVRMSFR